MRKTNVKNEKGITLIVLIITVIVLILLSMVIINFVVDGTIFNTAEDIEEKEKTQQNDVESLRNTWQEMFGLTGQTADASSFGSESNIIIESCDVKTKTIDSITVEVVAQSAKDTDTIIYELYVSTTEDGEYTKYGESVYEIQNNAVELTADGLNNYTVYYWYIKASNEETTIESDKIRTRTKCPGNSSTEGTTTCGTCNGTGTATYECSGGKRCTSCEGKGTKTCTGTTQKTYSSLGSFVTTCCGSNYEYQYVCSSCGYVWGSVCAGCGSSSGTTSSGKTCGRSVKCYYCSNGTIKCSHGETDAHTYTDTCESCNGTGSVSTTVTGCSHGESLEHDELPEDAT